MLKLLLSGPRTCNSLQSQQQRSNLLKQSLHTYVFRRNELLDAGKSALRHRIRLQGRNWMTTGAHQQQQVVRTGERSSKVLRLLLGGSAVSVTIGYQCRRWFVYCEAPAVAVNNHRLLGQKAAGAGDGTKFDWMKFWSYLRPHLVKLIGAVMAALAVAYFNIQIPNLLGVVVNTLSKYARTNLSDSIDEPHLSLPPGTELVVPVCYNPKMARSFPERPNQTEKQKARRLRNTIAARESRAKMKLLNELLQKESNEAELKYGELKRSLATRMTYARQLLQKLSFPQYDFYDLWEKAKEGNTGVQPIDEDMVECVLDEGCLADK